MTYCVNCRYSPSLMTSMIECGPVSQVNGCARATHSRDSKRFRTDIHIIRNMARAAKTISIAAATAAQHQLERTLSGPRPWPYVAKASSCASLGTPAQSNSHVSGGTTLSSTPRGARFAFQLPQRLRRKRGNVEIVQRKQWRYQPTAAPSQSSQSDGLHWYAAVHGIRVWGLSTKTLNSPRPPAGTLSAKETHL